MAFTSSIEVNTNPAMEDRAMIIIIIGDMIPADTAASPRIIPPRIEMALPVVEDILISRSLNLTKPRIQPKASTTAGKGTDIHRAFKSRSKESGMES